MMTGIQSKGTQRICRALALAEHCQVEGWFLPENRQSVHGLRAVASHGTFVARRKQIRPDVYFQHPEHPEALRSGFKLELKTGVGARTFQLQFKDSKGAWRDFCRLVLWVPPRPELWGRLLPRQPLRGYERWFQAHEKENRRSLRKTVKAMEGWVNKPLISLVMPVYNTPERWLVRAIASVRGQMYPHWELCVADDCSPDPKVRRVLERAATEDKRIKVVFREQNGHICEASNSALALCSGEFTGLLDHDDELTPEALLRMVEHLQEHPESNLVFSDEDKIDVEGRCFDPYFKPGWNAELLLSENAVCHFSVFRTAMLKSLGGFRKGFEGGQDWDLALRVVEAVPKNTIFHLPRVLYHWRTLETSTAAKLEAKPYASDAGARAVAEHLQRSGARAEVEGKGQTGGWRVVWRLPEVSPKVSVVIATRDRVDLLRVAVASLLGKTSYPDFELILVDHASEKPETFAYFEELQAAVPGIKRLRVEGPFNWSRLNNLGAAKAGGEVLLFLNNDVEIINADWMRELVANVSRDGVGAVGAQLLYPNGSIQHAGIVLRLLGMAGHVFQGLAPGARTMAGDPSLPREVTAVTGACLAVRRELFMAAGGFDEAELPVSYNDVDFCLRLRAMGLRNLYAAHAVLMHHESASRHTLEQESVRKAAATAEAQVMLRRWPQEFAGDVLFNANLSLLSTHPALPGMEVRGVMGES